LSRIWEALRQAQKHRSRSKTSPDRRRTPRRPESVPLLVYGSGPDKQPFHEETETINAAESGCLLVLAMPVVQGQRLFLANTRNQAERECRVVHVSTPPRGKSRIGVAFCAPAPDFWRTS